MTPIQKLATQLRVAEDALSFLGELTEAEVGLILSGLESAAETQKQQINLAIEESLGHVPGVLHKPIRRILFGQK